MINQILWTFNSIIGLETKMNKYNMNTSRLPPFLPLNDIVSMNNVVCIFICNKSLSLIDYWFFCILFYFFPQGPLEKSNSIHAQLVYYRDPFWIYFIIPVEIEKRKTFRKKSRVNSNLKQLSILAIGTRVLSKN